MARHVTVFDSRPRTATVNGIDIENDDRNHEGLVVTIDCTSITSAPSVVFTIQGKDPTSLKYFTILVSAAIVAAGTTVLRVHPDFTAAANTIAKDLCPYMWRVIATHGNTDSITYTVGASMI